MKVLLTGVLVAVLATGCASNVEVAYPVPESGARTGEVLVRFTEPMKSVSIVLDGDLVAEDEYTERVHVLGVPVGSHEVRVVAAAGSRSRAVEQTERVLVAPNKQAVVLVAAPPQGLGYWINSAAMFLVYGAVILSTEHDW